ncbi:MAG: TSUP family transporter [Propionibacteriaceae bacterium]|nr:TSUP family transporter [Propionibacteriaceae bacterium]
MLVDLSPLTLALLCLVALAAGWIDSVVGGGGVIQLPALLFGLPTAPVALVSGTNKLSSVAGTASATATYLRKIRVDWAVVSVAMALAFVGSSIGARLISLLPRVAFTPIVAVAVAAVGIYAWCRPELGAETALRHGRAKLRWWAGGIGFVVGVWDGMVGPGTGIFLLVAFAALLGYGFLEATTMTKLVNLTTNVAALVVLGSQANISWGLGAMMAACNLTGGFIGARMSITRGNTFIRKVFLFTVVVVEAKLLYDTARLILN